MFRRILVPVDGSTFSEHALAYAVKLATAADALLQVALVHVSYHPVTADLSLRDAIVDWERAHRQREADYLHELAARLGAESGRAVEPRMLNGDVVPALEQEIKQNHVDLIVMTTHGRAGFERAWLGSVADSLVRNVTAPVLLIRPSDHEPVMADGSVPRFSHILVALDGSERAERALAPVSALASFDDARVTLLRAVGPPMAVTSPFIPHAAQLTRDEVNVRAASSRAYIEDKARALSGRGVNASGEVVMDYHPAHALLHYADAHGVDLIAIGTHGRGPVTRLVLGSVSDKVVRKAEVPVLVC